MASKETLERKLAILTEGKIIPSSKDAMDSDGLRKFWSTLIKSANKDGDRLKASELLGRSKAMFTDVQKHEGQEKIIALIPMDIKGLKNAIGSK